MKIHYKQISEILQFGSGNLWRIHHNKGMFEISLSFFLLLICLFLSLTILKLILKPQMILKGGRVCWSVVGCSLKPRRLSAVKKKKKKISTYSTTTSWGSHRYFKTNILSNLMFIFSNISFSLYRRIEKANNLVYIDQDAFQHLPSLRYL